MILLKADDKRGVFLAKSGSYHELDKLTKDDLLWMVERILDGTGTLEPYNEELVKNQAHQVVYKSIYGNLKTLEGRRQEYIDESERLYLEDYKKYTEEASHERN